MSRIPRSIPNLNQGEILGKIKATVVFGGSRNGWLFGTFW